MERHHPVSLLELEHIFADGFNGAGDVVALVAGFVKPFGEFPSQL